MTNIPTISFDKEADGDNEENGRMSVDSEELSIISISCLFGDEPIRLHEEVDDDVEKGDLSKIDHNLLNSGLRSMMKNKLFKMRKVKLSSLKMSLTDSSFN